MKKYTLGIAIAYDSVIMVRKNRPEWQKGKLNFIGGKIEEEESARDCMIREFYEETGVSIDEWKFIGTMEREGDFIVYVYLTNDLRALGAKTTEDEEIIHVPCSKFFDNEHRSDYISNIEALFSLATSRDVSVEGTTFSLSYT